MGALATLYSAVVGGTDDDGTLRVTRVRTFAGARGARRIDHFGNGNQSCPGHGFALRRLVGIGKGRPFLGRTILPVMWCRYDQRKTIAPVRAPPETRDPAMVNPSYREPGGGRGRMALDEVPDIGQPRRRSALDPAVRGAGTNETQDSPTAAPTAVRDPTVKNTS